MPPPTQLADLRCLCCSNRWDHAEFANEAEKSKFLRIMVGGLMPCSGRCSTLSVLN